MKNKTQFAEELLECMRLLDAKTELLTYIKIDLSNILEFEGWEKYDENSNYAYYNHPKYNNRILEVPINKDSADYFDDLQFVISDLREIYEN
jgi:hypothetical protein